MDPFDPKCPIRLQAVPQLQELEISPWDLEDPLGEESDMVVPGLTHRYPDPRSSTPTTTAPCTVASAPASAR